MFPAQDKQAVLKPSQIRWSVGERQAAFLPLLDPTASCTFWYAQSCPNLFSHWDPNHTPVSPLFWALDVFLGSFFGGKQEE